LSLIEIPAIPILITEHSNAFVVTADGEIITKDARSMQTLNNKSYILCHAPSACAKLGIKSISAFDILELFAFTYPACFCVPTIKGMAKFFNIPTPQSPEQEAMTSLGIIRVMLEKLSKLNPKENNLATSVAFVMKKGGWNWANTVLKALGHNPDELPHTSSLYRGVKIWDKLPEWTDFAPENNVGNIPVTPEEARRRLEKILPANTEERPEQSDYASSISFAFNPRVHEKAPNVVLAEAGTGTGKTLGYIAPASLWSEKNDAAVWISTYTKNLQRQLDKELNNLYKDEKEKSSKVAIRKGRENYTCLLNYSEAVARLPAREENAIALGLIARWLLKTRDGDMVGGDLPGWLPELLGRNKILSLADKRGECIYASCEHYKQCFVEHALRRAKKADIVIANHALVMAQACLGGLDDASTPTRYIFDEGHHIFDAADSAFCSHLSGLEAADLRKWLRGAEDDGKKSRAKGLKRRLEDVIIDNQDAHNALNEVFHNARILPATNWQTRLNDENPTGVCEKFLSFASEQVITRNNNNDGPYSLETETLPLIDGLEEVALELKQSIEAIIKPLNRLIKSLNTILSEKAKDLEPNQKSRIEASVRSITNRALLPLSSWKDMLNDIVYKVENSDFCDWFMIEKIDGRNYDVGMYRHFIDPTVPFAKSFNETAHGIAITSATLRDRSGDNENDWKIAEKISGAEKLTIENPNNPPIRALFNSPFNYPQNSLVIIINDINKNDPNQVAAAYNELFKCSKGGALGIFTAISRLKATYTKIVDSLQRSGLKLLAQHADGMNTSTLIDIFKEETDTCLLGTDAVRDGVDIPGDSLRMIVFDRVPWPKPSLLHKARRKYFGEMYDDMLTRYKLSQAFGRLIRRKDDKGIFIILDKMTPTRLCSAFPEGVEIKRIGLKEAIETINSFLDN